jgi:transcriptional regulator with XRE-family HTH domain
MSTRPVPPVRLRRLATRLRHLREHAGLSQEQLARATRVNRSTVIAIEHAQQRPQARTLIALLDHLQATDDEAKDLLALLSDTTENAWLRPLRGRLPETYGAFIDLESEATRILWYEPLLIPGLLQTADYARAHAREGLPESTSAQIEARVTARLQRQHAFAERGAQLSAVITESALRYQVGGPEVLHDQLARLLETATEPNITLQLLPFNQGAHPSMTAAFGILDDFAHGDPPLVYQESTGGDLFLEDPADLEAFRQTHERLQTRALRPSQTAELITQAIQLLERHRTNDNGRTELAEI